jgi:hypothetical protein
MLARSSTPKTRQTSASTPHSPLERLRRLEQEQTSGVDEARSATSGHANRDASRDAGSSTPSRAIDVSLLTLALVLAVAAGVHGTLLPSHAHESPLLGLGFGAAAVAQLAAAVLVLVWPSRSLLRLVAAGSAVVVAAWVVSRTVGLPVPPPAWTAEPVGLVDTLTAVFEVGAIGLALQLLRPARRRRDPGRAGSSEAAAAWLAGSAGVFPLAAASAHESHGPGAQDHIAGHVVHAAILATAVAVTPLARRVRGHLGGGDAGSGAKRP